MSYILKAGNTAAKYICASGNSYVPNANGLLLNVVASDADDLINQGCTWAQLAGDATTGLNPSFLPLLGFKNADGTTLSASAAAGKFGLSSTVGTSMVLAGEAAQNNTKTDSAIYLLTLPPEYVPGSSPTVRVNAKYSGSGTAGTKTLQAKAYEMAKDGTQGSNLGSATQNLTTSNADYDFTVTGTNLLPGDQLLVVVETALQETGNAATIATAINSVQLR